MRERLIDIYRRRISRIKRTAEEYKYWASRNDTYNMECELKRLKTYSKHAMQDLEQLGKLV